VSDPGPSLEDALALYDLGLAPVPAPAKDGKSVEGAVAGFSGWRRRLPRPATEGLFRRHPGANVAILPHLCRPRRVVVDCDDDAALAAAEERHGPTPLVVRTPRGTGWHLYYRAPADGRVRPRNLRLSDGLKMEIKAGPGAVVVAPPSRRPSSGEPYVLARGDWSLLPVLPIFRDPSDAGRTTRRTPDAEGGVPVGCRNNHLFSALLHLASGCDGAGDLALKAHALNARDFDEPLPWDEVERTARKAWAYQESGRNWAGRGRHVAVGEDDFAALADEPDALALWMRLQLTHAGRRPRFAASPKGMAAGGVLPGWSPKRYRKALAVLARRGFLLLLHKGGAGVGDHDSYAFAGKGARSAPNTNGTPFPLAAPPPSPVPSIARTSRKAA
jgi:hypothetical protein